MKTNSNTYTILYAAIMVVVVAFLLAFVSSALRDTQDKNVELDKKKQILASLNIRGIDNEKVEAKYAEVVEADMIIKADGSVVNDGKDKDKAAFRLANNDISSASLPVYRCRVDGELKYVIPMTGRGLWGGLWGYISVNSDMNTIYGAYFSHESETAGLGALIAEQKFQELFRGKTIFTAGDSVEVALTVVKNGKVETGKESYQVDGITGATLTSNGVADMLRDGLGQYVTFLNQERSRNTKCAK